MPLLGWDYVELWVGNAKQAAYFYEHAMGFTRTAYAGPETGVRDRASYVLEQGDVRFVVTSALQEDHEITRHQGRHGDGVRDIALTVPDATQAYREAVKRGARGVVEPVRVEDELGSLELSAIATYGDTLHTFVNRSDYGGPFKPGYASASSNGQTSAGVGLTNDRPRRRQRRARPDEPLGRVLRARVRDDRTSSTSATSQIQTEYSALMSKVMADGNGKIKFPINEPAEGKRKSQIDEYLDFYGGPGVQHIAVATTNIVDTVERMKERGVLFLDTPDTYYDDVEDRVGEIDEAYTDLQRPGSSPTATTTATCCRSSRRRRRTGRRVLRGHRAPGRDELRRRELQGAVRGDRARAGAPREPVIRRSKGVSRADGTSAEARALLGRSSCRASTRCDR